jgi:hypothetical protein
MRKRMREEFENGRDYYQLEGQQLREPAEVWARPSIENLEYHAGFKGTMLTSGEMGGDCRRLSDSRKDLLD